MSDVAKAAGVGLRALDPDLPIVAARAAVQLDAAIAAANGKLKTAELRTDAIGQLAEMITSVNLAISPQAAAKSLADPLTVSLVSRAYSDASHANLRSLEDLQEAAKTLSRMFEKVSAQKQGGDLLQALATLRDFCIKLSEYAASKRQMAYGNRPKVSYWRLSLAS